MDLLPEEGNKACAAYAEKKGSGSGIAALCDHSGGDPDYCYFFLTVSNFRIPAED